MKLCSIIVFVVTVAVGAAGTPHRSLQATEDSETPTEDYETPTEFNIWCDQMNAVYGDTCECTTVRTTRNNIDGLDLEHTITCDPLPGDSMTCVEGVTVMSALIELTAYSVGGEGDFETIEMTQITDFNVQLETSIGTTSVSYSNPNLGQRTNGCQTVWGSYNCARCGICDLPEAGVQVSPNDIFNGLSGDCRFGQAVVQIGTYNVCENGDNQMTRTLFQDLAVGVECGHCPGWAPITGTQTARPTALECLEPTASSNPPVSPPSLVPDVTPSSTSPITNPPSSSEESTVRPTPEPTMAILPQDVAEDVGSDNAANNTSGKNVSGSSKMSTLLLALFMSMILV